MWAKIKAAIKRWRERSNQGYANRALRQRQEPGKLPPPPDTPPPNI